MVGDVSPTYVSPTRNIGGCLVHATVPQQSFQLWRAATEGLEVFQRAAAAATREHFLTETRTGFGEALR